MSLGSRRASWLADYNAADWINNKNENSVLFLEDVNVENSYYGKKMCTTINIEDIEPCTFLCKQEVALVVLHCVNQWDDSTHLLQHS